MHPKVLKGDILQAVESHELLYQVFKKYTFLPEAFTTTFDVYWGQYLLRPEFAESTYFLHKVCGCYFDKISSHAKQKFKQATNDPYYLHVGQKIIENLQRNCRVQCGFAAIKVSFKKHNFIIVYLYLFYSYLNTF